MTVTAVPVEPRRLGRVLLFAIAHTSTDTRLRTHYSLKGNHNLLLRVLLLTAIAFAALFIAMSDLPLQPDGQRRPKRTHAMLSEAHQENALGRLGTKRG